MTKISVYISDEKNKKLGEFFAEMPTLFNESDKGKKYNIYMRQSGFQQVYVGTYAVRMSEPITPTTDQKAPVIETKELIQVPMHTDVSMTAKVTDANGNETIKDIVWKQTAGTTVELMITEDKLQANFHAHEEGEYKFSITATDNTGLSSSKNITVKVAMEPEPNPDADIIYDSTINSKLHDGNVRTVDKEGSITPGGLGLECRASGNPRIQVNADKTFSLLCDSGHGRFYGYALNYNATLELECAFWNQVSGQDLSLKMRSRHNEGGDGPNRFGGYGVAVDRSGWGAKRELFHNEHDQSTSGSLPSKPETKQYFKLEFTVKDEGNGVRQIGKYNGKQFMDKLDSSPKPYMKDMASFMKQSYFWVRSNIDSGTGEIRIKRLRILKA